MPWEQAVFKINMAGSVTKPLIPQYVQRGVQKLKSPEMIETIKNCFQNGGLVHIAMLEETYQRTILSMPVETENIAIPEGFADEEYLGPNEPEDFVEDISSALQGISFDVEVVGELTTEPDTVTSAGVDLISVSDSDSSESAASVVVPSNKE